MALILNGTDGISDVDGTAATPAIRGTDANTGIFFPAADTIAFSEGGTESMRVDANGNLGLGTTTLQNDAGYKTLSISGSSGGQIAFQTAGVTKQGIYGDATDFNIINTAAGYTRFLTNNTERMRIGSAGQLGIGGANYGTSGQVLTSGGSGAAPSWTTSAGLGIGQTWQNLSGSRALSTTYTNSTGKPISVSVITNGAGASANSNRLTVDGNVVNQWVMNTSAGMVPNPSSTAIVPNGSTYSCAASHSIIAWWELR